MRDRGTVGRRRPLALALVIAAVLAAWIAQSSAFRSPPTSGDFGPAVANPWAVTLVPEAGRIFVLGRTRTDSMEAHSDILSVLDSQTGDLVASRYLSPNDLTSADNPARAPIDTHTGRVLLSYPDKVEEYDASSGRLVRTDPPGTVPEATDARTGHLFLPSYTLPPSARAGCGGLAMVDAATQAVIRHVPLDRANFCMAPPVPLVDAPARTIYVLLPGRRTILLLNPGSGGVRRTLTLPMLPAQAVLVGESGRIALAVEHGDQSCNSSRCRYEDGTAIPADGSVWSALLVLDGATGRILHRVDIQGAPLQVLSDARRGRIYVLTTEYTAGYREESRVHIIDAAHGALVSSTVLVGRVPTGMAIDDLTGRLLVPGFPPAPASDGSVPPGALSPPHSEPVWFSVFDPISGALLRTLPAGGRKPQAFAIDRATGRLYVANLCAALDSPAFHPKDDWLHHLLPFLPSGPQYLVQLNGCPPISLVLLPPSSI